MSSSTPASPPLRRRAFLFHVAGAVLALPSLTLARYTSDEHSTFPVQRSDAEWQRILGEARFRVMREAVMEAPLSSQLLRETRSGIYLCAGCGKTLFLSEHKLNNVGAWPTFSKPNDKSVITLSARPDWTTLVHRRIYCANCGGYLGMVFSDGADGFRFAINGLALIFVPEN